jgi:predicted nucleic acid-binding protein
VTYLLDTNAISDLMDARGSVNDWIESLPADSPVVTCVTVRGEVLYGLERLADGKRRSHLIQAAEVVFSRVPCIETPIGAATHYSALRGRREREGRAMDTNDLWIAATAMALEATLVTRDGDFRLVEGLSLLVLS